MHVMQDPYDADINPNNPMPYGDIFVLARSGPGEDGLLSSV